MIEEYFHQQEITPESALKILKDCISTISAKVGCITRESIDLRDARCTDVPIKANAINGLVSDLWNYIALANEQIEILEKEHRNGL